MSKPIKTARKVVVFFNPDKASAKKERPRLLSWLKKKHIDVLPLSKISEAEAVITLGGDGTILAVAPQAALAACPVLGINTGRLGFMTAVDVKHMDRALNDWSLGKLVASSRMMVEVEIPRLKKQFYALNDAVIRTGATNRVTRILATVNEERLGYFVGDGVIVATSTGSTAYSLSAQGPIVHPELDAMILTPICAHSFTQRPIVFSANRALQLSLDDKRANSEVELSLDGQRVFSLKWEDVIRIRRSPHKLELLHDPKKTYFNVLREKLSWGKH